MTTLDPKAAADAIRAEWKKDPPPAPSPEDRHTLSYLEQVCDCLGVDKSTENVAHVAKLMGKLDIDQHKPDEYPKMLTVKNEKTGKVSPVYYTDQEKYPGKIGQPVIFDTEEEESEFGTPPQPEELPPVEAPVPVTVVPPLAPNAEYPGRGFATPGPTPLTR